VVVDCAITLSGSFHSGTLAKTARALVGYINEARVARCEGGTLTVLTATLPWHVVYQTFAGTLPRLTSVSLLVLNAGFELVETFGNGCLFRTTAANPSALIALLSGEGVVTGLRADETARIPLTGPFPCELATANFRGTGAMSTTRETALTIRLI